MQTKLESGNPDFDNKRVDQLQVITSAAQKYVAMRKAA
jgi:hypothetical protein